MNRGFLPGDSAMDRVAHLFSDAGTRGGRIAAVSARLDEFLREAVAVVRNRFRGKLTYCAIPFEQIEWTPFEDRHGTTYPDMRWEPKAAFAAVAEFYGRDA
ncbi:Uncharacterised protein [Nocardia africana]|uniref:Uncharacterized protein n=2 Tax=Nocardia africana TaxID=134964 RepID=A0A378X4M1_9NOCA|nr:Uncharacterised protein [Nocardia africana]